MKRLILAISAAALVASAAFADPITERKALMKERGALVGQIAPIAKGEQPFDAAKVAEVFAALEANANKYHVEELITPDSMTGDTKASPKIWEDLAGFTAAVEKYRADVASAVAANPQDIDAFRTEFGKITSNCGSCHQAWRL